MAKPQAPKQRRSAGHQDRVMDLRNGNRTTPHKLPTDYRRRPKHKARGWSE